ncbi:MAG: thioredoxin domain-containing protein [Patescibacteria group bacterium]|nr:thioredoxin domain-containing protein [Patescibacteria group bacterium]
MENKQNILVPVSIIIAGLIIAGAIVGKDSFYKLLEKKPSPKTVVENVQETNENATKPVTANDKFKGYAKGLGLDQNEFDSCLDSGKYASKINETTQQANELSVNGTPTFFINGKLLVGAQPFEVFKAILDKELGITLDYPANIKTTIEGMKTANYFSETVQDIPISSADPIKGNADAPVTIVEFTDYQCPFCARHVIETLPQIQKEYIDTGYVKYILKDIPLLSLGHKNSPKASEASYCAKEQGKYWEMHDKIFETQAEWSPLATN